MRILLVIALLVGAAVLAVVTLRPAQEELPIVALQRPAVDAPAMCPWREPQRDMRAFFPGATSYRTDTLILTSFRAPIIKRLGPGTPLESNALYVYRITEGATPRGTILVRRASGQYGAIEVVVGLNPEGRVAGVRIQRQREPAPVASALTSESWLSAFRGKTADSRFELGDDIPDVPAARTSAQAVVGAVRSLLIEYDEGKKAVEKAHH